MKEGLKNLNTVTQNLLLGTITGLVVGNTLRYVMVYEGASDWIWIMFFILGPLLGYFSGKERERLDQLEKEKQDMEDNFKNMQSSLKRAANRYKLLVEQSNDAMYLTTVGGRFIMFNEATSLLSGYRSGALKKMTLSQLRTTTDDTERQKDMMLDNKVCRYEDEWRTKTGDPINLDVVAKWIQISGHKLILHVGRNIRKWQVAEKEDRSSELQMMQKEKLEENAATYKSVYQEIVNPMDLTVKTINELTKRLPNDKDHLTNLLTSWNKTAKMMQGLALKANRDSKTSPGQWNLNNIIIQELQYLKNVLHYKGTMIRTSLSSDIKPVIGFGIDYSLAFGTILRAALGSIQNSKNNEMIISTRLMDDHILAEIQIPDDEYFGAQITRIVDPLYGSGDSQDRKSPDTGISVVKYYFESFGGKLDIGQNGKGMLIRVRIPCIVEEENAKRHVVMETTPDNVVL